MRPHVSGAAITFLIIALASVTITPPARAAMGPYPQFLQRFLASSFQGLGLPSDKAETLSRQAWPHFYNWTHSEVKVTDRCVAYDLKPVDFTAATKAKKALNLLTVQESGRTRMAVPAKGALVAWASQGENGGDIGLTFINVNGFRMELTRLHVDQDELPADRTCLGLDVGYDQDSGHVVPVVAWSDGHALHVMAVPTTTSTFKWTQGVRTVTVTSPAAVTRLLLTLEPSVYGLSEYDRFRQVQVVYLGKTETKHGRPGLAYLITFMGRNERKPGEYGYDLLYAVVKVYRDETGWHASILQVGGLDLGFQSVVIYRIKPLSRDRRVLGLAVMARWRQESAGVWFVTLGYTLNEDVAATLGWLSVLDYARVSDDQFYLPQTRTALLDFAHVPAGKDRLKVLVVWNDSRFPWFIVYALNQEDIRKELNASEFIVRDWNRAYVLYAQRLEVDFTAAQSGTRPAKIVLPNGGPSNEPVAYLASAQVTGSTGGSKVLIKLQPIDSVSVYPARSNGRWYFLVDYSVTLPEKVAVVVDFAYLGFTIITTSEGSGSQGAKVTHGYDVFTIPVPAEEGNELIGRYVEITKWVKSTYVLMIPITLVKKTSGAVYSGNLMLLDDNIICYIINMTALQSGTNFLGFSWLYDTVPYIRATSPEVTEKARSSGTEGQAVVNKNQIYVKTTQLAMDQQGNNLVTIEGFLEPTKGSESSEPSLNVMGTLFVREFISNPIRLDETFNLGIVDFDITFPLEYRPLVVHDHPMISATRVEYVPFSEIPKISVRSYYTTDFYDEVPTGTPVILVLKDGEPLQAIPVVRFIRQAEARRTVFEYTDLHVRLLEVLKDLLGAVDPSTHELQLGVLSNCVNDAMSVVDRMPRVPGGVVDRVARLLEELSRYLTMGASRDALAGELRKVLNEIARLASGRYTILIYYLPENPDYANLPTAQTANALIRLLRTAGEHRLVYLGPTSWLPLTVECHPLTIRTTPGGKIVVGTTRAPTGGRAPTTPTYVRRGTGVRPFQRVAPVLLPIAPPRMRRRRS